MACYLDTSGVSVNFSCIYFVFLCGVLAHAFVAADMHQQLRNFTTYSMPENFCRHSKSLQVSNLGLLTVTLQVLIDSVKHRKSADLTARGAETSKPISMKLEIHDYVRNPTPQDKFGGVALRGWSGQIGDLPHLFLCILFCFLCHAYVPLITFLDQSRRSIH